MSRIIDDDGLRTWEVFASTGAFGLAEEARIVFQCRSDPRLPVRFVVHDGNTTTAQRAVEQVSEAELRGLLAGAQELN